ncbi:DUF445 domain-containing protein [Halobacillus campisalis]|uniref:DUF445 domain-containing protein n=1 Tax=Halobacillus campisalis TaxID=435909 RepID=A0ABW2K1Y0_9BACI|nr:DUF445 family protein [Halobacillus campisalis]
MNAIVLIILMMVIGAAIGGVTNSLAIKMLFRPYKAIYIGKYRLPFTPGLIPKRQPELAKQLGRMVVEHLLTAEGLKRKIEGQEFQNQLTNFAQREVEKALNHEATLQDLFENLEMNIDTQHVEESISTWIEDRYEGLMEKYRDQRLKDLITDKWSDKAEAGADQLAVYIQEKVHLFLASPEGKEKVGDLIDDYLNKQGFLGNMIQSFMGSERVIDRVHPVIIRYVTAGETTDWLQTMLRSELYSALNQRLSYFENQVGKHTITKGLGQAVTRTLPIEKWLNTSIAEWSKSFQSRIIFDVVPLLVPKATVLISSRIEKMMESMHLSEIVQEEVDSFNVGRLEEMVLGISKREFKMITYLGALLGGMIGIFQGILVLLFG